MVWRGEGGRSGRDGEVWVADFGEEYCYEKLVGLEGVGDDGLWCSSGMMTPNAVGFVGIGLDFGLSLSQA